MWSNVKSDLGQEKYLQVKNFEVINAFKIFDNRGKTRNVRKELMANL